MKRIHLLILVWIVFIFGSLLFVQNFPYRVGYEYTEASDMIKTDHWCTQNVIATFANFDGIHYLNIAQRGYIAEGRFFPVYPMFVRTIATIHSLGSPHHCDYFLAGWVISISSLIGCWILFKKLFSLDHSAQTIQFSRYWLLAFPTAFFFFALYSESLFLFFTLLAFYFSRMNRWRFALLCVAVLSITRIVGVIVLLGVLYEYVVAHQLFFKVKNRQLQELFTHWKMAVGSVLSVSPLVIFSYVNYRIWGDWLYFLNSHTTLGNSRTDSSIVLFPQTIVRYIKILFSLSTTQHEWKVAFLELSIFLICFCLLILAWKKRVRFSYQLYAWLVFLIPVSSGTFTGLPRYALLSFPIFIVLGMIKNTKLQYVLLGVSFLVQLILLGLFSRGYYVA